MDLHRPLGVRARAVVDGVVAAVLAGLAASAAWDATSSGPHQVDVTLASPVGLGPRPADWAMVAVAALAAPFARRRPAVVVPAVLVLAALSAGTAASPAPWVAVAAVLYPAPRALPARTAGGLLAAALAVAALCRTGVLHWPWARPELGGPGASLTVVLILVTGWTAGYATDQRRRRRAEDERSRLREERVLIARELHDVVAHSLGVIAVQAGVANHIAAQQPEQARLALASIEETSRTALDEMRALLGVLRTGEDGERLPAPRLSELDEVVRRAAAAGVRVELELLGERRELPPGLELAGYRVVQEAVTNVVRHAGTDRCRVRVEYRADALALSVVDEGRGGGAGSAGVPGRGGGHGSGGVLGSGGVHGSGGGHGLAGMRERVAVHGGELRAGRREGRGFEVAALFPLAVAR
ncbi:sensor histidine kinase [Kitasatospora sp. NPDC059795]|uniref:sensor histidine kinase n=1 Tax=Kitasatospora sp. NPDC059795 TaxID=3346949 RepID=UPI00365394FC